MAHPANTRTRVRSTDSSKIVTAMLVAFNQHVWQMWQARTRRSKTMPAVGGAAPMDPIFNNIIPP